ncbi:MAG TPA: hypothetical protein VMF57_09830 [Solirubrobacteraceae bacterium]|nr:hypothetical protein [Solirubrobacteraceae bacterium]
MTLRRVLVPFALVAAIGLGVASPMAPAAIQPPPSLNVRPVPPTCDIAGQTCSIHPCVEFIAGSHIAGSHIAGSPIAGSPPQTVPRIAVVPRLATPACTPRANAAPAAVYVSR